MTTETFKQEAQRIRPALVRQAFGILHDSDEAEDVVQDVLLRLWQMRDQLQMPVEPLAKVLTRNRCIDLIRRKKPAAELTTAVFQEEDQPQRERIERMMKVIEALPDLQQTILRLLRLPKLILLIRIRIKSVASVHNSSLPLCISMRV